MAKDVDVLRAEERAWWSVFLPSLPDIISSSVSCYDAAAEPLVAVVPLSVAWAPG